MPPVAIPGAKAAASWAQGTIFVGTFGEHDPVLFAEVRLDRPFQGPSRDTKKPSLLAENTLGSAIAEAKLRPHEGLSTDGRVEVEFFWDTDTGRVGAACYSKCVADAAALARALEAFWRVDHDAYGSLNARKWQRWFEYLSGHRPAEALSEKKSVG